MKENKDELNDLDINEINEDKFLNKIKALYVDAGSDKIEQGSKLFEIIGLLAELDNDFAAQSYMDVLSKDFKLKKTDMRKMYDQLRKKRQLKTYESIQEDYDLPEGTDFKKAALFGFYEHKNCYFFLGEGRKVEGSNFVIKPLIHIYSKRNDMRIVEIENCYGLKKTVDVNDKEYVSPDLFQVRIIREGNFIWKASKAHYLKVLSNITNHFPVCNEVSTLGWQREGFYAYSNGIFSDGQFKPVDELGTVSHKESHYFLPAFSVLYASVRADDDDYENDRFYMYKRPNYDFNTWCTLMHKVYLDKAPIAIGYAISALFRDLIYDKYKIFPHLFLFGEKQSGKSQLGWTLSNLFNDSLSPFNLTAGTNVGFFRRLARVRNGLVWFDEYTNDIDEKRVQALKAAYDGVGHEKGLMTQDNRTQVTKVNSACIISGQYLPTRDDNALFTRSVLVNFVKRYFSQDDITAYNELKSIEEKGITGLICELLHYRDMMDEKYAMEFDAIFQANREAMSSRGLQFDERILRNYTIIQTVVKLFVNHAPSINLGIDYAQFSRNIIGMIEDHSQQISTGEALSTFWNMVEFLLDQNMIQIGKDVMIDSRIEIVIRKRNGLKETIVFLDSKEKEYPKRMVWIRLVKIFPLYMEHHRKQYGSNGIDKTSLQHYLTTNPAYIGYQDNARFNEINTSAYVFDYDKLRLQGVNLDRTGYELPPVPIATPNTEDLSIKDSLDL